MTESLLAGHVTVIFGEARFVGPRQVVVEAQRGGTDAVQVAIEASNVVINTGSAPRPGGVPGADLPLVHDSISIQHLSDLPRRLVVVGAGAVGLEFAQMFAGFGSQVTLLSRAPCSPTRTPTCAPRFLPCSPTRVSRWSKAPTWPR